MFQGETAISVDDKGRLAIPTAYRELLARVCNNRLVIAYNPFEPGCLWMFPQPEWERVRDQVNGLSSVKRVHRDLQLKLVVAAQPARGVRHREESGAAGDGQQVRVVERAGSPCQDPSNDRRGGSQRGNGGTQVVTRAFGERRMAPGRMGAAHERRMRAHVQVQQMDGTWAMTDSLGRRHIPVMREAVVAGLALRPDGRYLDGTFGRGGHARAILDRLGDSGRLLLMDRDPEAIAHARCELGADPRVAVRHANFSEMSEWDEVRAGLDGVLLDLGVSSPQLDDAARGFSFQSDAPLDMRMDPTTGTSAAQFLAQADEREIADVLFEYGEERMSRRIARAIVARRDDAPIRTARELAELVERVLGRRERNKHPATRTFQALRLPFGS